MGHGRVRRNAGMILAVLLPLALLLTACGGGGGGGGDSVAGGGHSTVYAGTPIAPGTECAFGGVRIDYGIDENANGVLDSGEVDGYSVVCNGAGSSANPVDPPSAPAAQYTLRLVGGSGTATGEIGGNGGSLSLDLSSSGSGHIKLFETGVADASFDFPTTVTSYLGANPLVVEADLVVDSYDITEVHPALAAGLPHTHRGLPGVFFGDGGTGDTTVTGISVAPGITLTFALASSEFEKQITVPFDIRNEGTLAVGKELLSPLYSGNLYIVCDTFYGAPGSRILANGIADGATGEAGSGGHVYLEAYSESIGLYPYGGAIYNQGTIDTSGADADQANSSGGNAGSVWLFANLALVNTGLIDASGGDSAQGQGGFGGPIGMDGYFDGTRFSRVHNAGTLDNHGGKGLTGGGDSGSVQIISRGDLLNSGDILSYGGDGTDPTAASGGGTAGNGDGTSPYILRAYGGSIISSGDLLLHAGNGMSEGWGGTAAQPLTIETYGDNGLWQNLPAGGVYLSGNIDLSGGSSLPDPTDDTGYTLSGGQAASLFVAVHADGLPAGQEIQLLGYTSIDLSGGAGGGVGGNAGSLTAINHIGSIPTQGGGDAVVIPAGGVHNHVPVTAQGGNGGMTFGELGGSGGAFTLMVDVAQPSLAPWQVAANHGSVNISGGSGYEGGTAGSVAIVGPSGAQNHGDLTAMPGETAYGAGHMLGPFTGQAGIEILSALGPAINSASITSDGGLASGSCPSGVDGNIVMISGTLAVHTGELISLRGGDVTICEGLPGDGGVAYIWSRAGVSTVTGGFDIAGGTFWDDPGSYYGNPGRVLVDGINRTEDFLAP